MKRLLICLGLALALAAAPAKAPAGPIVYGVTTTNQLFTFDADVPQNITVIGTIPALPVVGIDFRPSDGALVGLGQAGNIGIVYTINPQTAAATPINFIVPSATNPAGLSGSAFGFDFNPVPNALRIVSNTGQNLRITAGGAGDVIADGPLNGATNNAVGAGYTNNFAGAAATTLYDISAASDQLFIQSDPNAGTTVLVGPLGVNTNDLVGFDIFSPALGVNIAYASLTPVGGTGSNFYTINLATGAATLVGPIGNGTLQVRGIAVLVPEPGSMALLGMGAVALVGYGWRRRRKA